MQIHSESLRGESVRGEGARQNALPVHPPSLQVSSGGVPASPLVPGLPGPADSGSVRLPAPPAPGSAAERAELDQLKRIAGTRTPEGDAWARRLDDEGKIDLWRGLLDRYTSTVGRAQAAAATALLGATLLVNAATTQALKLRYRRDRPFDADPTLPALLHPRDKSYPSGHASNAFAAARVLSRLAPQLTADAYDAARQVAESRVYAGVHFPSDVLAGARVGTAIADAMLHATPGERQRMAASALRALAPQLQAEVV